MKRRIIAALMALCLCIGLLPATALAVGGIEQGDLVTLKYETGAMDRTITVNVYVNNELKEKVSASDGAATSNTIRIIVNDDVNYEIDRVDQSGGGGSLIDGIKPGFKEYEYPNWAGSDSVTFDVYLREPLPKPSTPNGVYNGVDTIDFRAYYPHLLKLLYLGLGDKSQVKVDTEITEVTVNFVEPFGYGENTSFNRADREEDYLHYTFSNASGLAVPNNVESLTIASTAGTVTVGAGDLRFVLGYEVGATDGGPYYSIEANNDDLCVVYFYNETTANNYVPYAVRFVESGQSIGEENMPDPPEYGGNSEFVAWTETYDGGRPFLSSTIVEEDLTVFSQRKDSLSASSEIHVMNDSGLLKERIAELYELNESEIDWGSVKISVYGKTDDNHTNPDYNISPNANGWRGTDGDEYYFVYNYPTGVGDQENDQVYINDITKIVITAQNSSGKDLGEVTINKGIYDGDFWVSTGSQGSGYITQIFINDNNTPDPDPEPGDDYAITDVTKTLVDTAEKAEAAGISGEYDYPDPVNGNKVIIPEDDTVTLLYAITVEGKPGASFTVTDKDATLVAIDSVAITQTDDTFTGSIPADAASITFYVSKTFTAADINGDGNLTNTATVAGDADPDEDEDTEETPAEEEDPTKPDFDDDVLAGVTVQVLCVQKPTDHKYVSTLDQHPEAYETKIEPCADDEKVNGVLLPDGYDWKCTVSISKEYFVKYFNDVAKLPSNLWGEHELAESGETTKIVFYYGSRGWERLGSTSSVIIQVREKSTGTYTLTYDFNGGIYPQDDGTLLKKNSVTLAPGNYNLDEVAGYLEPVPNFDGQGEKVLFAGWTKEPPKEREKVYHYNDSDIPEIEETVTITDQPVTVYAVWSYDENDDEEADINQIVVKPADITIYMGGTGYEGTVDASGNIITSTDGAGLPEPGFIVTLPAGAPANTEITDLEFKEADGGDRTWRFETYDGQEDTVVYKLVPQGDEQTATRVQFTKANGEVIVSDEFTVGLEVNTSFTMALYKGSGATAVGKIVAEIDGKSYSVNSDPTGTLTVRGTTDGAQYAEMTPEETRSLPEEGKPAVMAPVGTTYAINGGDVQVQDSSGVALLFDAIIDHADEDRTELLQDRAEAYFTTENIQPETGKEFTYEFKYLDLVDQNNGNVWVAAQDADGNGRDVTVYWPLPEGTNADTKFTLLHFKGLHREMATGDIATEISECTVEEIQTEVVGSHVTFKIGSAGFSPFALVWQEKDGTTPAQYTVTYHENFGSSTDTRQNDFAAGTQVTVITNPFGGHSNYAFDGWNTRADGNGTSYGPGDSLTVNGNITLYAQWDYTGGGDYNPKDATLRFNSRGGTEFDDIVRDDPFEYNPYNKIPSRPGYRFTGWYNNSSLDRRYPEDEKISVPKGITTVWAGWEETSVPSMLNGDDHYAYIQGYSDGTVRPNANITRAQVATIFFRLLDEDVRDDSLTTYNTFPDVDEDYWANTAISTMASLGVINGRNSGLFDPDAYITRAEFAAICARFDDSGVDGITTFTDTVGHWAEDEISRAAALGWIQGYSDGTFRPNQYITRAQAVTMINRVLCRLPEDTDDLLSGMNTWTDCHEDDWFYLAIQEATNSHDFVAKDRVYESWTDLNRAPGWSRYE